jgi:hypothetical protein
MEASNMEDIINTKRMNRVRIEWMKFLDPFEYVLLDKMLFQSNIESLPTYNGIPFHFHVRALEKETNINRTSISRILDKWSFIDKKGENRNMIITLNYNKCIEWTVSKTSQLMSDCLSQRQSTVSISATTSKHLTSTCTNGNCLTERQSKDITLLCDKSHEENPIVPVSNSIEDFNENINNESIVPVLPCASILPHLESEYKTVSVRDSQCKYIISRDPKQSINIPLSKGIKDYASPIRQKDICKTLNKKCGNFVYTGKGYKKDGYGSIAAIDNENKCLLITANDSDFITNPKIQEMIAYFSKQEYQFMLWTANNQKATVIVKDANV